MTHPLLHVATPEKRARRAMVAAIGKRQAKKEYAAARHLDPHGSTAGFYVPPAPRCHRRAFHRVDAAFEAIVAVLQAHPQPGALRVAAMNELPVYRSRGHGKRARR